MIGKTAIAPDTRTVRVSQLETSKKVQQPNVSIIIPVYNTEKHLRKCLKSACGQTLKEIEIIVVDDHSPGNCGETVRALRATDSRIVYLKNEVNKGTLHARQAGVRAAAGRYILFLDSDDWLELGVCEKIYEALRESGADACRFGAQLWKEGRKVESADTFWTTYDQTFTVDEHFEFVCTNKISCSAWSYVMRASHAKELAERMTSFPRITVWEDGLAISLASLLDKTIVAIPFKGYNHNLFAGVMSQIEVDGERFARAMLDYYQVHQIIQKAFAQDYPERLALFYNYLAFVLDGRINWVWPKLAPEEQNKAISLFREQGFYPQWQEYTALVGDTEAIQTINLPEFKPVRPVEKQIALLTPRLTNGGVERVVSSLAGGLEALGWHITLITEEPPSAEDYPLPKGTERLVLPKEQRSWALFINNEMQKRGITLLSVHNLATRSLLYPNIVAYLRFRNKHVTHSDHGFLQSYLVRPWMYKDLSQLLLAQGRANSVTTLSPYFNLIFSQYNKKTVHITNPSTFSKQTVAKAFSHRPMIVWIGRLEDRENKRPQEAVEAFALLHKKLPQARLIMVGGRQEARQDGVLTSCQELANRLGVAASITFTGYQTNVRPYLQQAHIHWLTSANESWSMVWLEAKSYGVPTVTYRMDYLVLNGPGSCVVEQGDYQAMADASYEILTNQERYQAMSAAALEDMDRFDNEKTLARWNELFMAASEGRQPAFLAEDPAPQISLEQLSGYHTELENGLIQRLRAEEAKSKELCWEGLIQGTQSRLPRPWPNCLLRKLISKKLRRSARKRLATASGWFGD